MTPIRTQNGTKILAADDPDEVAKREKEEKASLKKAKQFAKTLKDLGKDLDTGIKSVEEVNWQKNPDRWDSKTEGARAKDQGPIWG